MRTNRFTSWSSARVALASAAFAGVAIIAACSEGGVASNLNSPSLRLGESVGPGIANAHIADICVSSTSPNGVYTFQNSSFSAAADGLSQHDAGTTTRNDAATPGVAYTLTKDVGNQNPCVGPVLFRNSLNTVQDDFSAITVTNTGTPSGVVYSSTDCVDDPGVAITNPCGIASRIHANSFHGSKATYNFVPASTGCTYTHGWYKNQGNSTVPTVKFFGPVVAGVNTGPVTWRTQVGLKATEYDKLAYQYIAAKLSVGAGTAPAPVAAALSSAETFFTNRTQGTGTPPAGVASTLDVFVNGGYAGWPHC